MTKVPTDTVFSVEELSPTFAATMPELLEKRKIGSAVYHVDNTEKRLYWPLDPEIEAINAQIREVDEQLEEFDESTIPPLKDILTKPKVFARYNTLKDIAADVFGKIADIESVPVKVIYERYEVNTST